ncbi:MAG: PQQ-binding-like beta-propeller repeat protein [Phycisphaerae bacterium]|nr:PQQ-binding-like beta-propeller repeat protein [Phycisphaerae bacterium]
MARWRFLEVLALGSLVAAGCAGPPAGPSAAQPPLGMPVQRKWVVSLPQRFQQAIWRGYMFMPDKLLSPVVRDDDRVLSVEGQLVEEGFARRLRLIERSAASGKVLSERVLASAVPEDQGRCRILRIDGAWYVAHAPWAEGPTPRGILTPWPSPKQKQVDLDAIRAAVLPEKMARYVRDGDGFAADGRHLLVSAVLARVSESDTRAWLAVASVDVKESSLAWSGQARIPFAIDRHRTRVRVERFGGVVLAHASLVVPHGRQRCRDLYAAFDPETGRLLWSRSTQASRQPSAFDLVADGQRVFIQSDESTIEAWQLANGAVMWQQDVDAIIVADGALADGELITFVGDDYPAPGSPAVVRPIAVSTSGQGQVRRLSGEMRAAVSPSLAVLGRWLLVAPDDRLYAWSLLGDSSPLVWQCWRFPGGLLPEDAAGVLHRLDAKSMMSVAPATGALTLLELDEPLRSSEPEAPAPDVRKRFYRRRALPFTPWLAMLPRR